MGLEPYGTAISDAIERGDAARLSRLLETAREIHAVQGVDLSKAIRAGEAALKKLKEKK
ncbi:MAG TPA: hypothetical protein VJZ76_01610 [Thermoanaerobaculia bacterium]|nr:hypothetical protein [Thermoanaerobaculia bacterium]